MSNSLWVLWVIAYESYLMFHKLWAVICNSTAIISLIYYTTKVYHSISVCENLDSRVHQVNFRVTATRDVIKTGPSATEEFQPCSFFVQMILQWTESFPAMSYSNNSSGLHSGQFFALRILHFLDSPRDHP